MPSRCRSVYILYLLVHSLRTLGCITDPGRNLECYGYAWVASRWELPSGWRRWRPRVSEARSSDLFAPVDRRPASLDLPATELDNASVVRRRLVKIDLERLHRAREAASARTGPRVQAQTVSPRRGRSETAPAADEIVTLNLFGDIVVRGIVEWTSRTFSGGYSISGRLVGDPLGMYSIVVNGETVAGTVRTLGGTYRIRSAAAGLYAISEVEEPPFKCVAEQAPHFENR